MSLDLGALTDAELAALTLAGRQQAFGEILRRHQPSVYRLARAYVGDADEALDMVQESFLAAYRALASYDPERPLRAWLARIAINKCRDWARRRAVRSLFSLPSPGREAAAAVPESAPPADEAAAARQELDLLWRDIAALPRTLKETLILRTIDGLSQAETARALGISGKAVETRLYRARQALARRRESRA